MKKYKFKRYVLPTTLITLGLLTLILGITVGEANKNFKREEHLNYVSSTIISKDVAVINTTTKVIYPYTDQAVTIGKNFYDYKGSSEEQENSIIFHENTYIQNSGVDFVHEQQFTVISILDGTVTNVKEDELLGKTIEITHDNDYVSVYQSLSEINVKKGDNITQGQILGKSGTNKLDQELGNHLHFELYIGGQIVNPTLYLDKEVLKTTNQ